MKVLVTGSAGHIGQEQVKLLREAGHEVRTFDRHAAAKNDPGEHIPGDLRDIDTVRQAVRGMDAVAHLGAIPTDIRNMADQVLEVNVKGTWNVLIACVEAGVNRVINFSSINALGCVGHQKPAVRFPIEDSYPRHPWTPYQISKHLTEETCRAYSEKHGLVTISLRPGYVAAPDHYAHWHSRGTSEQQGEWQRHEYWAYVDRRDVCQAVLLALTVENVQNDAFLLMAKDSTIADIPTIELVEKHFPETPWMVDKAAYFADNPYRSVMDCTHAKEILGWEPVHSWRDTVRTPAE